jgi:uncharacterized protein (DUF1778 family)
VSRTTAAKAPDGQLQARISHDQNQRAAELQGRTPTDCVIAGVHEAAVRVIEETQTIRLSDTDSRASAKAR